MTDEKTLVADLLRLARVKQGLTQAALAEKAGVAQTLISAYENVRRQPTLPTLVRLLKAAGLERLGFETAIVERAFDGNFHPDAARGEPTIAVAGFDKRDPRLLLGNDRFTWVVDGGLGAGPVEYLDIVVNTFPAPEAPALAFPQPRPRAGALPAAYEAEIARLVGEGAEVDAVRCGMLDIAGVNIGAAFVGAFAGTLVIADLLRLLHGGPSFSVVSVDLRDPEHLRAVPNPAPGDPAPAFTFASGR
ncbi:MAG: helix-turn-helix domain-containing protein [Acidimicrobiales bacterium]